ncbi:hypothetical protein E2C01_082700 [Portunus trituberculatus]|uniref:Uncharacterized protein n=1 Tax=Portunus trituberculatus TaxID=210409 RepID=A0A5B7IZZ5_PORTR|nr:hypothetical protein [Portunus trituberculatus]
MRSCFSRHVAEVSVPLTQQGRARSGHAYLVFKLGLFSPYPVIPCLVPSLYPLSRLSYPALPSFSHSLPYSYPSKPYPSLTLFPFPVFLTSLLSPITCLAPYTETPFPLTTTIFQGHRDNYSRVCKTVSPFNKP